MKQPAPKKKGRPKSKHITPTVSVSIRLSEDLVDKLEKISEIEGRSRTKQVEMIVKDFCENYNLEVY